MRKYIYTANVKGQEIETQSLKNLAEQINSIYEFPIVTQHTLNNFFTRPHLMKLKCKNLESLALQRVVKGFI